jgi:hypothetical protein
VRNLLLIERYRTSIRLQWSLETDWEGLLYRTTLFLQAISEGPSPLTIVTLRHLYENSHVVTLLA